jgi:signal transduction histidine kinase
VEHGSTDDARAGGLTVRVGPLDVEGFYVADNGPGIDPSRRDRIFELGHTDADGGSGLGLAIVREIADAHGWAVDVTDGADGGARFELRTNADVAADSSVPR